MLAGSARRCPCVASRSRSSASESTKKSAVVASSEAPATVTPAGSGPIRASRPRCDDHNVESGLTSSFAATDFVLISIPSRETFDVSRLRSPGAEARLLLLELGGEGLAEVGRLEDLANLDLGPAVERR